MARRKKEETLVHLDLEEMVKPVRHRREPELQIDQADLLTVGSILQQARTSQKLKLSVISKKLCIKEIYLDALEKGHYYAFPGLAYGVGFLRTYANYLGLDASELIDRFHRETSNIKTETMELPRAENTNALPPIRYIVKSLAALILLYLVWFIIRIVSANNPETISIPDMLNASNSNLSQETSFIEAPVSIEEVVMVQDGNEKIIPSVSDNKNQQIESTNEKEDVISSTEKRIPKVYGLNEASRVSFVATDKVQIEVRDIEANRVLVNVVLEKGDSYNPISEPEGLVLKTENAGALSLYIDGKFIRPMGKKGISKSGISMHADDLLRE